MDVNRRRCKILVADDDAAVHSQLGTWLTRENYEVLAVRNGRQVLEAVRAFDPDIVLLDIGMPGLDGYAVCGKIRKDAGIPVMLLASRVDERDKLRGLEAGADDYITKPFSPREVVARIKAVLRRLGVKAESRPAAGVTVGNLEIDLDAFVVRIDGRIATFTPKETEILWTLASNPGIIFSREHLLRSIWGYDYRGDPRAVDSHIKRLRAKLAGKNRGWEIRTVWGEGYRLDLSKDE